MECSVQPYQLTNCSIAVIALLIAVVILSIMVLYLIYNK